MQPQRLPQGQKADPRLCGEEGDVDFRGYIRALRHDEPQLDRYEERV